MNYFSVTVLLILWLPLASGAQVSPFEAPERFGLEHLSAYLGLKPSDISFRSDYTEPDSFRLAAVARLMHKPLEMIEYTSGLKNAHVKSQPEILAGILFTDLGTVYQQKRLGAYRPDISEIQQKYNLYHKSVELNKLLSRASLYLDVIFPRSMEMMLSRLDRSQVAFLTDEFKDIVTTREDMEFLSAEALDSLEKMEEGFIEQFTTFGGRLDKDPVIAAGIDCLRDLLLEIRMIRRMLDTGQASVSQLLSAAGYLPDNVDRETYLGYQSGWAIGSTDADYYQGDYRFILDFGGDDVYDLSYDPANPHGVIIIDLGGNDHYRAKSDFALGSGCLSVGLLLDFEGDDRYDARSFGLGSGFFGFGLLYDARGDDHYDGDTHVQGAASFGLGLLIDEDGRDRYNAAISSQGFGFAEGFGMIYDMKGADAYYAGGKYKDALRYDDRYQSLSQGFGFGMIPQVSGGIGAIIDLEGNDLFHADIYAQGSSYWWSLGLIYDSSGNDTYQAYQYGQGAGAHMSLGALIDDYGNDVYSGKGLMQGCGHDYACGLILDRNGNDTYTAYDLSQAAGSANGVGLLIDNAGDDRYFSKNPKNTQGYGNPRRAFGSIGLFMDLGGTDQYAGNGKNDYYWKTDSKWGGGMDIELFPPDSAENDD